MCHHVFVSRCVRGEQSDWSPVPGSSQRGLVPVAEPASLPAGRRTAHTPQPQSDGSLPGNTLSLISVHIYAIRPRCLTSDPPPPTVCVCRTCCPWLEIPPREQPTTTLRILLTSGCSHPSLSKPLHPPPPPSSLSPFQN